MKLEQGKFCPLIGKDCIGIQCSWFTQIRGMNPQTGEEVDEWECAVKMMPILLIENSQMLSQTGGAIESFRNETVKSTMKAQEIYQEELKLKAQQQQSKQLHNISPEVEV